MLKVLFIHRDLPFHGGVPRCLLNFAQAADRARVRPLIASLAPPSAEMSREFAALDAPVFELGDRGYVRPARKLRAILQSNRPDAVVCNSFKSWLVARIATTGLARPPRLVCWLHGIHAMLEGRLRQFIHHHFIRHEPIICTSDAVKRAHAPRCHRGPLRIIHNGVPDFTFDPADTPYDSSFRETLGIPLQSLVIAFTAEFIEWKDHPTILRAFDALDVEKFDAHLLLVGAGQRMQEMQNLASGMRTAKRVHFLGARRDARRLLGAADIYCHVADGEGFGLAVVEAMLAAKPVVAARAGALPEIISHDQTGLLFEPRNPAACAEELAKVLASPALRARLGDAGRQRAVNAFSVPTFAAALCDALEGWVKNPTATVDGRLVTTHHLSAPPNGDAAKSPLSAASQSPTTTTLAAR